MRTPTQTEYETSKAALARYSAWSAQYVQKNGWTVIPANAPRPADVPADINPHSTVVELFELARDKPPAISAYIGKAQKNGMGIDRIAGQTYTVTTWTGEVIGYATKGKTWSAGRWRFDKMHQFHARIHGREYTGRGQGEGMFINLRETAESKRKNPR